MGRPFVVIALFSSFGFAAVAQNLVPNPGFEDYKIVPCELNKYKLQELLHEWFQPLPTTTDYYNDLADTSCVLNPSHWKRSARTGNGAAGIIALDRHAFTTSYREYIEVELKQPLTPGRLYYAEFYASCLLYTS